MSTLTAKIQLRRDTSANWTANNPILLAGEVAFTSDVFYTGTDQQRYKIGDGVQTWTQLDYVPEGGGGGTAYPEHLYLTVVNKTGDNLLASGYKVVKVVDAQGQRLAVDYALADSDTNSADTIGVVFENIDNNQEGKIVVVGDLSGLDTTGTLQGETWVDGDAIFLSATTPGGITNVKPTAPDHGVRLGYVVYAHANQGKIYIKIDNGYELDELHNVYAPSPNNNDGLFWSSGNTRYENKTIAQALGYTPENTSNKSTDGTFTANSDTLYPSQKAVKTYADGLVTGLLDDRGNYDASGNVFPSSGGSGIAGAILKGDLWYISVGGTLGGTSVVVGSSIRALVDSPGQTSSNWSILNVGLGYVPENQANKGVANGYASLDANGIVPGSQIKYKTLHTHGFSLTTIGSTSGARWTSFGSLIMLANPAAFLSNPSYALAQRLAVIPKTGIIKSAKISLMLVTGTSTQNHILTFRNNTTSTTNVVTSTFQIGPTTSLPKTFVISGLNIAVTENDVVHSVIESPQIIGTVLGQVSMTIDYVIE